MRVYKIIPIAILGLLVACSGSKPDMGSSFSGLGGDDSLPPSGTTLGAVHTSQVSQFQEQLRQVAGDRVFFSTDQYSIDGRAQAILSGVATWLQQNPGRTLVIEGHADERGTREYNLALSDRRATAVKNHLTNLGVSPSRMTTLAFGKERPAAAGSITGSWAQNRRAFLGVR